MVVSSKAMRMMMAVIAAIIPIATHEVFERYFPSKSHSLQV